MIAWLTNNISTIVVLAVVIVAVAAVVVKMVRDRLHGKSSCSCGCENCAIRGECHK